MSFTVRELQEQARAVRAFWRARPKVMLSAEGACLLSMVDVLPRDGVVVSRTLLATLTELAEQWADGGGRSDPAHEWVDQAKALLRGER